MPFVVSMFAFIGDRSCILSSGSFAFSSGGFQRLSSNVGIEMSSFRRVLSWFFGRDAAHEYDIEACGTEIGGGDVIKDSGILWLLALLVL